MYEESKFEILKQIGHGQFSTVYKARWVDTPSNTPITSSHHHHHNHHKPSSESQNSNDLLESTAFAMPDNSYNKSPLESNGFTTNQQQQEVIGINRARARANCSQICGDKYVAVKRIKFYEIPNSQLRMDYLKEVNLLKQLKHPNIINYYISLIERNELYIVLELADGGDLSRLIRYYQRKNQLLCERVILKYFTQVCSAVRYIHSKRILHRDIKPANIFMTSDGCVKLGDFGLGRFFSQNTRDAHSIVGTLYYMSPERIRESGYGFSSDVWSLGCVLYELITLSSPFSILDTEQRCHNQPQSRQDNHEVAHRQNIMQHPVPVQQQQVPQPQQQQQANPYNLQWLIDRIVRAEYPSLANYTGISLRLRQLITECLNPNPDARPNMDYICTVVGAQHSPTSDSSKTTNSTKSTALSTMKI